MLVTVNHITMKYLDKTLFQDASFTIQEIDKIGIIGMNGVGKSTLLDIIVGDKAPDEGMIYKSNDIRIGYLPQTPEFIETNTLMEEMLRLTSTLNEFEAKTMLNKLGLLDHTKMAGALSGGEKKRLSLAVLLISPCDLLILDEPTNHLDIWMINWLEKYLIKYNKAILLVTHDRYFLERITNKTIEIDGGKLFFYDANYSKFLELKAERLIALQANFRKLSAILKKELEWGKMNPAARSTKSRERLLRLEKLGDNVKEVSKTIHAKDVTLDLKSQENRIGKKTILIEHLSKTIGGKTLFQDVHYLLRRYDRLGIVGPNGCGKTTFFQTLLGYSSPDNGTVTIGETVRIGYFQQEALRMKENLKMIDYVKEFGEFVETADGKLSASQLLELYLFPPSLQQMPVSILSGGEKRRLQLLTVLLQNPNVLILDEPTNDLDIYTLEILEDYLENFCGAVIVVSHDRYFLDKVTDHLLVFQNASVLEYPGTVETYVNQRIVKETKWKEKKPSAVSIPKFTSQEKKEFDMIEERIADLEKELQQLQQAMNAITTDYQALLSLQAEKVKKEILLEQMLERWTYLNELNEQIQTYRKEKYHE